MKEEKDYLPLEFKGNAKEYFKIYIVNLFLSIITLGIYSAWAKVRKNRYLYSNTYMEGSSFEYTANPVNILKGRLLVVGAYALFIVFSDILHLPIISMIIALSFVVIVPYLIHLAFKFRLRYVKYRGINFSYQNKTSNFYKFYILNIILLNIVTLGLAGPHNLNKYFHLFLNGAHFSNKKFEYEGKSWPFYKMWLKVYGITLIFPIFFILAGFFGVTLPDGGQSLSTYLKGLDKDSTVIIIGIFLSIFYCVFILIIMSLAGVYYAMQSNYIYKETDILDVEFKSEYNPFKMGYIYASNIVAIFFSFGLLGAWATIRLQRYKTENFYHTPIGDLQLQRISNNQASSLGEESSEFFDMDLG
ncbi:YjgN family protein [Sulfurospirillum arcachonense]|uniref:YjgN family protein n=1 Tax=Sulfurospirillum arcachonense TaxID=57666 RepID=UPI000468D122|nr:YjgN family protein [Sulfurospirillum arcachonense]